MTPEESRWITEFPVSDIPELSEEFDPGNGLPSELISIYSGIDVAWVCKNCGKKFLLPPRSRYHPYKGFLPCGYCTGDWPTEGSLEETHPELVFFWDTENNIYLRPWMVTADDTRLIWWICPTKGHHWKQRIKSLVSVTKIRKFRNICLQCKYENLYFTALPEGVITPIQTGDIEFECPQRHRWRVTDTSLVDFTSQCPVCGVRISVLNPSD